MGRGAITDIAARPVSSSFGWAVFFFKKLILFYWINFLGGTSGILSDRKQNNVHNRAVVVEKKKKANEETSIIFLEAFFPIPDWLKRWNCHAICNHSCKRRPNIPTFFENKEYKCIQTLCPFKIVGLKKCALHAIQVSFPTPWHFCPFCLLQ